MGISIGRGLLGSRFFSSTYIVLEQSRYPRLFDKASCVVLSVVRCQIRSCGYGAIAL